METESPESIVEVVQDCKILHLPNELFLKFIKYVVGSDTIVSFSQSCKRMSVLCQEIVYSFENKCPLLLFIALKLFFFLNLKQVPRFLEL